MITNLHLENFKGHRDTNLALKQLTLLVGDNGSGKSSVLEAIRFAAKLPPSAILDELVRSKTSEMNLTLAGNAWSVKMGFQNTQIIATTHSPYVLDEIDPSNVIAFALRDDGTVATKPLSEHPDAAKVNGSLKTGELWTLDAERDWVR